MNVLLAVRNEGDGLRRTLDSLPRSVVQPIIIPNGCTDDTEAVAHEYQQEKGAIVVPCDEEGKMRAIQAGIRHLGSAAVEPFLTIDAGDSRPIAGSKWPNAMLKARRHLPANRPAMVIGPLLFRGGDNPLLMTAGFHMRQFLSRWESDNDDNKGQYRGTNTLVHPLCNSVVASLLELDNYWPGEDQAIKDEVVHTHGGTVLKSSNPFAIVETDGSRMPGIMRRLRDSPQSASYNVWRSYMNEAPKKSRPYESAGWFSEHEPVQADAPAAARWAQNIRWLSETMR